jgi:hypothetical protein
MPGATKDGMPVIGANFSGPKDNSPRMTTLQSKKVEESLEEIEKIMAPKPREEGDKTPLTKEEQYLKNLTDAGVTIKESRHIMEQMVTKGYYEEDYKIGSVTVTLRTRVYEDMIRTQRALEIERPEYATAVQELLNRYNTAASLVRYGEHFFKHEDPMTATDEEMDAAFEVRVRFMKRLAQYISLKIQQHAYSFDQKMVAVFGEGAPQDF